MSKIYLIFGVILVSLLGTVAYLNQRCNRLTEQRDIYRSNTSALLTDVKRMQIDSTTMAVDVKSLKLTLDEYKEHRKNDVEHIKRLGVEIKNLKAASKHVIEIEASINAYIRDSIIIRDTVSVNLLFVKMDTPFLYLNGLIENNQLTGKINLPVNLHQAIWVEYKHRFLWWRWKVKAIHQTISSDNPHVEIKYSELIYIN